MTMTTMKAAADIEATGCGCEVSLWRAVLAQQITDATTDNLGKQSILERDRARAWLSTAGEDFRLVCAYAFLEWEAVRDVVRRLQANGWQPFNTSNKALSHESAFASAA